MRAARHPDGSAPPPALAGILGICPGLSADPEKFSGLVMGIFAGDVSALPRSANNQTAALLRVHRRGMFLDGGNQSLAQHGYILISAMAGYGLWFSSRHWR